MGLFDFLKKGKRQNGQSIEPLVNTDDRQNFSTSEPVYQPELVQTTQYPKCNCDGCPNQESCKYGHIIYDELDKTKLSLADKFMMLHTFDTFEPVGDYDDIATVEERHHQNKLRVLSKDRLISTLSYLEEQKRLYLNAGKCGRAYYNFMNMGGELQIVKETIKDYEKFTREKGRLDSVKTFILGQIDNEGSVLQVNIFKEYGELNKSDVAIIIKQMADENIIVREKSGNTFRLSRRC